MKYSYSRDELLNLEDSLQQEYLLTNGRGGYCSSTILDCHKRKYNGLLVVPVPGQAKRFDLLSKLDVTVRIKKNEYQLGTNKFPNVYYPTGHQYLEKFDWDGYPVTTFRIGETLLTRSLLMPRGSDAVLIRWEAVKAKFPVTFKAEPFFAYRDIDSLMRRNMVIRPRTFFEKNGFKFDPYEGLPPVFLQTSRKSTFYPSPNWWTGFEYLKERNRGYDYQEDLFTPGAFEIRLKEGESVIFRAGLDPAPAQIRSQWIQEETRLRQLKRKFVRTPEPARTLKIAAENYIIEPDGKTADIIAGYHWFGCWGRDTMLSLAGLTLVTKWFNTALKILQTYAAYQKDGLLPNMVGPDGGHAYNSIDAILLYFRAVQQYLEYSKDKKGVSGAVGRALLAGMNALLDNGVPNVRLDHGFLYAGTPDTNLTWMDADAGSGPVTPRHGAAVEINALWYNAMQFLLQDFPGKLPAGLKQRLEHESDLYRGRFMDAFWCEESECLYDVYRGHHDWDPAIRPNQLFALGLPFGCVPHDHAARILETVRRHLVTPYGLRTLSPQNPAYKNIYTGSQEVRDSAYHQGMVWPWLIGIYADAEMACSGNRKETAREIHKTFSMLWSSHLHRAGLDHISEIFTPNPPHQPKGCIAQAWSAAEVLRVLDMLEQIS